MSLDSGENCKDHKVPQLTFTQLSLSHVHNRGTVLKDKKLASVQYG